MAQLRTRERDTSEVATAGENSDVLTWLAATALSLMVAGYAVASAARLGSQAPPFLGYYQPELSLGSALAPVVAAAVLWAANNGLASRMSWRGLFIGSFLASFAWMVTLALWRGTTGLTRYVAGLDGYTPDLTRFTSISDILSTLSDPATAGAHPPGPLILLWLATSSGIPAVSIGLLWIAIAALAVPLVAYVARAMCGPLAARRLIPVLILTPYAVWAGGPDAITATLGAACLAATSYASRHDRLGWAATGAAALAGALLAAATLFSYVAAWLGLSVVCLYFARRRAWHNLVTGATALLPLAVVQWAGFNWVDGLGLSYSGFLNRVSDGRSLWWWMLLSIAVLLLACGPALVASIRKAGDTGAWPLLVGAWGALLFSLAMGIARGGVEQSWLTFFPWLIIAATAPYPSRSDAAGTARLPLIGAATAITIEAVLVSPW